MRLDEEADDDDDEGGEAPKPLAGALPFFLSYSNTVAARLDCLAVVVIVVVVIVVTTKASPPFLAKYARASQAERNVDWIETTCMAMLDKSNWK